MPSSQVFPGPSGTMALPQTFLSPDITAPLEENETAVSKLAYRVLVWFIFLTTSRLMDYTLPSLHLPLILSVIVAGLVFIAGRWTAAFSTRVGKFMGLYVLWFIFCIPFSGWRGGSFEVLTGSFIRSVLLFMMVVGCVTTVKRVRGVMLAISLGTVVVMVVALMNQYRVGGRLSMERGQLSNSNDLAQMLLLGMCLLPVIGIAQKKKSNVLVGLAYLTMLPFLYTVLDTGSRGALISLAILAILIVCAAKMEHKVIWGVTFAVLGAGLLTVSETARVRLSTLFSGERDINTVLVRSEEVALASVAARVATLKQSLLMTVQSPLVGVGPGFFQDASADMSRSQGARALWLETHNTYTQISSETGIPGIIFYGGGVISSILGLLRLRRTALSPHLTRLMGVSTYLLVGFIVFAFTSFFSSVAYMYPFWMLLALCAATIQIGEREVAQAAAPAGAVAPLLRPGAIALPQRSTSDVRPSGETSGMVRSPLSARKRMRG